VGIRAIQDPAIKFCGGPNPRTSAGSAIMVCAQPQSKTRHALTAGKLLIQNLTIDNKTCASPHDTVHCAET